MLVQSFQVVKVLLKKKIKTLNSCGVKTAATPSEIGSTLIEAAKEAGIYESLLTVNK